MNPYTKLPKVPVLAGRQEFVINYCRGKRVLHLGCVDAGLLEERFQRGKLMHQKLAQVTTELWGVDIDAEGIEFLRAKGFDHLFAADASQKEEVQMLQKGQFDVILASEVVEHLQNPGMFFQVVKSLMAPNQTKFIVTVPNAFRIDTLLWLLSGVEYVHPDHNYWFSYLTIQNLFKKNGFQVSQVLPYSFQSKLVMPRKVKQLLGQQITPNSANDDNPMATASSLSSMGNSHSLLQRGLNYLRTLPKRVLVSWLYSKTSFWGDGLIVVGEIIEP